MPIGLKLAVTIFAALISGVFSSSRQPTMRGQTGYGVEERMILCAIF